MTLMERIREFLVFNRIVGPACQILTVASCILAYTLTIPALNILALGCLYFLIEIRNVETRLTSAVVYQLLKKELEKKEDKQTDT